jgi:hypothetical protein
VTASTEQIDAWATAYLVEHPTASWGSAFRHAYNRAFPGLADPEEELPRVELKAALTEPTPDPAAELRRLTRAARIANPNMTAEAAEQFAAGMLRDEAMKVLKAQVEAEQAARDDAEEVERKARRAQYAGTAPATSRSKEAILADVAGLDFSDTAWGSGAPESEPTAEATPLETSFANFWNRDNR